MKKPFPAFVIPLVASTIAGVALWLSRASFDVAGTTAAPIRVAMLPSLAELIGLVVMALLLAAGVASVLRRKGVRPLVSVNPPAIAEKKGLTPFWEPAADVLLPLFALMLLVLPYLPWIADWIPAVRLFAGPGRFVIWVVVLGQVLWLLLRQLRPSPLADARGDPEPVEGSRGAAIFGIASVAVSAPFVLNLDHLSMAFVDIFETVRRLPSTEWSLLPTGVFGLLFDQEYGLFPFAPVLLLAFVGLAGMLRAPSQRRVAIGLVTASLFLLLLPATLNPWWSKSAMPGQTLVLLLPLLAVPIASLYGRLSRESLSRPGAQLLLLFSVAITLAVVLGFVPIRQEADGSSGILQWMSPTWRLWSEAPTFVVPIGRAATARVLVWLAAFGAVAWTFSRLRTSSRGRAALMATTTATLVFIALVSATSVTLSESTTRFDVERRPLFPLLETFDPVARPISVRYDPFSITNPAELPPLFAASAVPGERTDPQPVRVLLNARFRLPAGRYVVDLRGSESAGNVSNPSIALQLGREGRPIEGWPLKLGPGERARREFDVPLDAEFVGFRASRSVEGTIAELRLSPLAVVETRKRFAAGTVLSAAVFAPARVFFHDSYSYPETEGFWVRGRTTASMTLLKTTESQAGILLAVHSGARANIVTLATPEWSQRLDLVPGVTQRITVPSKEGERFIPLTIESTGGFVPAEVEASRDRRLLGAWIAFIPDDIARTSATP